MHLPGGRVTLIGMERSFQQWLEAGDRLLLRVVNAALSEAGVEPESGWPAGSDATSPE
jgi:hypothetical protein